MKINLTKTKWLREPSTLKFYRYPADGSVAIRGFSDHKEPQFTFTICVAEYDYTPPEGKVVIKDYSENEGVLDTLIDQGVVLPPSSWLNGPNDIMFPICELTPAAKQAAGVPL